MERYFILDNFNTWYDWRLILTSKEISEAEPKTNYVEIDGMSGSLDLSESLTGETTFKDRTITASFWTSDGTRKERESLLRDITIALHGKKIKIIEPDDPDVYYYGRVKIKSKKNTLAYAEFTIEATCDPWRYALEETVRQIDINSDIVTKSVINYYGTKTICPDVTTVGSVNLIIDGETFPLTTVGTYKISNLKLKTGVNIIGVYGSGSLILTYREASI